VNLFVFKKTVFCGIMKKILKQWQKTGTPADNPKMD